MYPGNNPEFLINNLFIMAKKKQHHYQSNDREYHILTSENNRVKLSGFVANMRLQTNVVFKVINLEQAFIS